MINHQTISIMKRNYLLRLMLTGVVVMASACAVAGVRVNCQMDGRNQVYEDGNVCLSLVVLPDGHAELQLYNKTSEPIVVDRARSFAYVNGASTTLFVPSVHTESSTTGYGVVDVDRLPHAGRYQTGTYHGSSHTSTHTEWDRPLQHVAPHGTAVVYVFAELPWLIDGGRMDVGRRGNALRFGRRGHFIDPVTGRRTKFRRGDEAEFTASTSPLSLASYVRYALGDAALAEASQVAEVSDFVRRVRIGGAEWSAPGAFSFVSGGGNGFLAAEIGALAAVAGVVGATLVDFGGIDTSMPEFPW